MANSKISGLTNLATILDADEFPIVDSSASATKKVLASAVKSYAFSDILTIETEETIEIAVGVITVVASSVILQAQAGVADDLDTINADSVRNLIWLKSDTGDTITVKHGTGNIYLNGAADKVLDDPKDVLVLWESSAGVFTQFAYSDNA